MLERIKITVVRKYSPEEVLGHEVRTASSDQKIPACTFLEDGQEEVAVLSIGYADGLVDALRLAKGFDPKM